MQRSSLGREARSGIWKGMAGQFGLGVDDALIDCRADLFPNATRRDIKGLAKLIAQ